MDSQQSSTQPPTTISSTIPIISSHNQHIRSLLDAIDELRKLDAKEGIALPTIVVVGDQSHGKSSVLESLSGISLPRGHSLCTRVMCPIRSLTIQVSIREYQSILTDKSIRWEAGSAFLLSQLLPYHQVNCLLVTKLPSPFSVSN